jgi:nucleotide-binding universal stress UspA family protein
MRIVLAIDDSEFSRAATESIATRVRPDAALVHVIHVVELDRLVPPPLDFARGSEYGPDITSHLKVARAAAEAMVRAAELRLQAARFATSGLIRDGDPRHEILNYAAEWNADWIVLGSHGRRGFDRFFMGSVSEAVARHAHCSVQIVRVRDWAARASAAPQTA